MAPGTEVRWRVSVPTSTFSSAVIWANSRMFWKVRARPRAVIWWRFRPARFRPSKRTSPSVGW